MSEILNTIESQIKDAEARLQSMQAERDETTATLASRKTAQESAILEGKKTSSLDKEIQELSTRLGGIRNALDLQSDQLAALREEKKAELRRIAQDQAENAKAEIFQIESEIYSLLTQGARLIPALEGWKSELRTASRNSGKAASYDKDVTMVSNMLAHLREGILDLMRDFPPSIREGGSLPRYNDVKHEIKRPFAR